MDLFERNPLFCKEKETRGHFHQMKQAEMKNLLTNLTLNGRPHWLSVEIKPEICKVVEILFWPVHVKEHVRIIEQYRKIRRIFRRICVGGFQKFSYHWNCKVILCLSCENQINTVSWWRSTKFRQKSFILLSLATKREIWKSETIRWKTT